MRKRIERRLEKIGYTLRKPCAGDTWHARVQGEPVIRWGIGPQGLAMGEPGTRMFSTLASIEEFLDIEA